MKKQIIIAALAAGMGTTAMADVSFSGKYVGQVGSDGSTGATISKNEIYLGMKATAGNSVVILNMENKTTTGGSALTVTENYIKTKVGPVAVKLGNMKGQHGNGLSFKKSSASNKMKLTTTMAGVTTTISNSSGDKNVTVDVAGKYQGVKVKVANIANDARVLTLDADVQGIKFKLEDSDRTRAFSVSTDIAGVTATYAQINLEDGFAATQNNGIFGNITDDVKVNGVILATDTSFGRLTGKFYNRTDLSGVDAITGVADFSEVSTKTVKATLKVGQIAYSVTKVDNTDASFDAKLTFKF